jgi:hypothetical protein
MQCRDHLKEGPFQGKFNVSVISILCFVQCSNRLLHEISPQFMSDLVCGIIITKNVQNYILAYEYKMMYIVS